MPNKQPPKDKQFKPGQSGNPKGRTPAPKDITKAVLDELGADGVKALIARLNKTARAGSGSNNIRAAEVLLNRGYGMPTQPTDLTTKGESINHPKELKFVQAPTNGLHPDSINSEAGTGDKS